MDRKMGRHGRIRSQIALLVQVMSAVLLCNLTVKQEIQGAESPSLQLPEATPEQQEQLGAVLEVVQNTPPTTINESEFPNLWKLAAPLAQHNKKMVAQLEKAAGIEEASQLGVELLTRMSVLQFASEDLDDTKHFPTPEHTAEATQLRELLEQQNRQIIPGIIRLVIPNPDRRISSSRRMTITGNPPPFVEQARSLLESAKGNSKNLQMANQLIRQAFTLLTHIDELHLHVLNRFGVPSPEIRNPQKEYHNLLTKIENTRKQIQHEVNKFPIIAQEVPVIIDILNEALEIRQLPPPTATESVMSFILRQPNAIQILVSMLELQERAFPPECYGTLLNQMQQWGRKKAPKHPEKLILKAKEERLGICQIAFQAGVAPSDALDLTTPWAGYFFSDSDQIPQLLRVRAMTSQLRAEKEKEIAEHYESIKEYADKDPSILTHEQVEGIEQHHRLESALVEFEPNLSPTVIPGPELHGTITQKQCRDIGLSELIRLATEEGAFLSESIRDTQFHLEDADPFSIIRTGNTYFG
ncbi:MAG: hypothetical protein LBJ77_04210 [Holosporales bacterium]|nr:hypothetical protein [Holosporales bacterium]